jgi:hypothetical protein
MGAQIEVLQLHRFEGADGCRHHLLLRAAGPGFVNADQAMADAANDFADSSAARWRADGAA